MFVFLTESKQKLIAYHIKNAVRLRTRLYAVLIKKGFAAQIHTKTESASAALKVTLVTIH